MKKWLIRTKSNHILGPLSKEKLCTLYNNGSLKNEDEVCSGNGYWFSLKEKELVSKYILGHQEQDFDPLNRPQEKEQTQVANLEDLGFRQSAVTDDKLPSQDDLEYPTHEPVPSLKLDVKTPQRPPKKSSPIAFDQPQRNDRYLNAVLVLLILLALGALVYRRFLVKDFFNVSSLLIPEVQAQTLSAPLAQKKSSFLGFQ